jgi:hypothetical protein
MNRRRFLGAGGLALATSLAGCIGGFGGERGELVEQTFPAPEIEEVRVHSAVGDVDVVAQGTGGVTARVEKRARSQAGLDKIGVDMGVADGVLTVETTVDTGVFELSGDSPNAAVTVTVPASGPGPVVSAVLADIGDVTVMGTRGDGRVRSGLGDITVSGVDGYLTLGSQLGAIRAQDVTGLDDVHTELGDVTVDVHGVRGDLSIGTELGEVSVGVAEDLDLDVLVETEGGITSNLPLADSQVVHSRLTGRLNRGGNRLHAFSELGDVSLRSITR